MRNSGMNLQATLPFLLLLLPSCDTLKYTPGDWKPPVASIPVNPSYPSCASSSGCPWGEWCEPATSLCTNAGSPLAAAFDFTLPDRNANSAFYGKDVTLSEQVGLVTVIYFGLATCSVCWQQSIDLQALLERLSKEGTSQVTALVINDTQANGLVEAGIGRYTALPVLQDSPSRAVWLAYLAQKDTVVVVDANGFVQKRWTFLDIGSSSSLLEDEVRAAGKVPPLD